VSRRNRARLKRYINYLEPERLERIRAGERSRSGPICLQGLALGGSLLEAPFSAERVIGYRLVGQAALVHGGLYKCFDYTRVSPFSVEDSAGGRAQVQGAFYELLAWPPASFECDYSDLPEALQQVLIARPYPPTDDWDRRKAHRWLEWVLRPGDALTVVGQASTTVAAAGVSAGFRRPPRALKVAAPLPDPVQLIVGDQDQLARDLPHATEELPPRFIVWGHDRELLHLPQP
jgi:hypothetical protein